jgi:hypothetical protein
MAVLPPMPDTFTAPDGSVTDRFKRPTDVNWCASATSCDPGPAEPLIDWEQKFDQRDRLIWNINRPMDGTPKRYFVYPQTDCENVIWNGTTITGSSTPTQDSWNERFERDPNNNVENYEFVNVMDSGKDFEVESEFNLDDESTGSVRTGDQPKTITPTYDLHGNIRFDGYRHYKYDSDNHLTNVYHVNSTGGVGTPWARFRYDALGRLMSAVYNDLEELDSSEEEFTEEELFQHRTIEFYVYDDRWRIVGVFRAGPIEGTETERPKAKLYERFVYGDAGFAGLGGATALDHPVLSQIDADGDGLFERDRRYLQSPHGDVVGLSESNKMYALSEEVRYTLHGYPLSNFRDDRHFQDFDGDNDYGTDQDIEAFFACLAGNCCSTCESGDINRDGDIGTDQDIELFFAILTGDDPLKDAVTADDNRFGFRGYWSAS